MTLKTDEDVYVSLGKFEQILLSQQCFDVTFTPLLLEEGQQLLLDNGHLLVSEDLRLKVVTEKEKYKTGRGRKELALLCHGDSQTLWDEYGLATTDASELRDQLFFNSVFLNTHPKSYFAWNWRSIACQRLLREDAENNNASKSPKPKIAASENEQDPNSSDWQIESQFVTTQLLKKPLHTEALRHLSVMLTTQALDDGFDFLCQLCGSIPSNRHAFVMLCEYLVRVLKEGDKNQVRRLSGKMLDLLCSWRSFGCIDWEERYGYYVRVSELHDRNSWMVKSKTVTYS